MHTTVSKYKPLYELEENIQSKIEKIAKEIYRARGVVYTDKALEDIKNIEKLNKDNLPICIAKTPSSFSDDPKLLNCPKDWDLRIREVKLSNGAGFLVALAGNILTMPGLPKIPAAVKMEDQ